MTLATPRLTRRASLQAKVESSYGTTATFTNADGVLVANPQFSVAPNVLERNFVRPDLSPLPFIIGRKIAKMEFETELRGNGRSNSGLIGDLPIIGRLMRACGYAATAHATSSAVGPYPVGDDLANVVWTSSTASGTNTSTIVYWLEVTTGGASGSAQVTITSDTAGEGSAAAAITSGTPIALGTSGCTITATWTGNLTLGQRFVVWINPPGTTLKPVSDNFESITLEMNKDGVKHVMPGSFGTFEITASAGAYATIKWTFTGLYVAPVDAALDGTIVYERTLPAQVELARLKADKTQVIVEKFTFAQNNDIQIRPDVSSAEGYIGIRIVGRRPEGGINPEAELVADYDFWGRMAAATRMPFNMRIGKTAGNIVWMIGTNTQYTGMTYTDRNGILSYDAGLRFSRSTLDDEMWFHFA